MHLVDILSKLQGGFETRFNITSLWAAVKRGPGDVYAAKSLEPPPPPPPIATDPAAGDG